MVNSFIFNFFDFNRKSFLIGRLRWHKLCQDERIFVPFYANEVMKPVQCSYYFQNVSLLIALPWQLFKPITDCIFHLNQLDFPRQILIKGRGGVPCW